MKGSTIGLIAVSVLVLLIGGVIAFVFGSSDGGFGAGSPQGSARRASTLSNVKQFNLALMMYATDYDDRLPVQMKDVRRLRVVVEPYVRNRSIYDTLNPNGGTIEPNENLAAALYSEVVAPDSTIMVFETNDWPDGGRILGFTDGHAKYQVGFDMAKDLEVKLTPTGEKDMEAQAAMLEAQAAAASGPPPTSALGMPGG